MDRLEEAKRRRARFAKLRREQGLTRESCEDDLDLYAWVIGEAILLRKRNDELKRQCKKLEAQLTAEEQCAMESGGILSDVCDLVFDDPERAAIHGYEGVHNKIAEIKNRLRLYQIQIDKYCGADNVGCDGFCAGCPLGKCGVNNGEKTKTKSL